MFRSLPDHHQEVYVFLVKVTELKCEYSCVVMLQHNIQCIYVMLCCGITTHDYFIVLMFYYI
jgi:hypothetical protein